METKEKIVSKEINMPAWYKVGQQRIFELKEGDIAHIQLNGRRYNYKPVTVVKIGKKTIMVKYKNGNIDKYNKETGYLWGDKDSSKLLFPLKVEEYELYLKEEKAIEEKQKLIRNINAFNKFSFLEVNELEVISNIIDAFNKRNE